MKKENVHLTFEDIAVFLEGGGVERNSRKVADHLKRCADCRQLVQDASVHVSVFDADPDQFEATSELVDLGEGPALARASMADATPRARRPLRTGLFSSPALRAALGALAIAVFAVGGGWWFGGRDSQSQLIPEVLVPVQSAMELASARGPVVIPGGENFENVSTQAYRSGATTNPELEESLDYLLETYQAAPDREVAYWLIAGLLSSGQIDVARDYARDARRSYPDDANIGILAALVAYTDGDLVRAETILRAVAEQDKGNIPARINLAVVLIAQDRQEEAREVFAETRQLSSSLSARLHELESAADGQ